MKTYTLSELQALKAEYLETLSEEDDEWYWSPKEDADSALAAFFGWLNIKENTP